VETLWLTLLYYDEGLLNDINSDFTWTPSDPFNGMTRARTFEDTNGSVFSVPTGNGFKFMTWEVPAGDNDFSVFKYLSFRAAQGTRHPLTTARLDDESWVVFLIDGSGNVGFIDFGVYGGGIEEPYQRTGSGIGAGWQNEFETVRIRLTDFLTGRNSGPTNLALTDVRWVGFIFANTRGLVEARIGLDDLEVTVD